MKNKSKFFLLFFLFVNSNLCFMNCNAQCTNLLYFKGAANGKKPTGSLISDGTFLYGMTQLGGTYDFGTIFKIMLDGGGYIKLLDFSGTANGSIPVGSLISDGTFLYGLTVGGGINNDGVVFNLKSAIPSKLH